MKTFIFLIIIIIAFFSYIFMFSSDTDTHIQPEPENIETEMTNLESFEKSVYERAEKKPRLTSQNLEEIVELSGEKAQPISEQMTFDLLTKIIRQINQHYPQNLITLNTPMHSLLRTQEQKILFKEKITASFGIKANKVDGYMRKNKLLWDWVNVLQ